MLLLSSFVKKCLPVLLLLTVLPAQAQTFDPPTSPLVALTQAQQKTLETRAISLIESARKGQYAAVRKQISPTLIQQITNPDAFIKQRWEQVIAITGPVKKILGSRVLSTVDADLVIVNTEFENLTDQIIVTFNKQGEVVGLNFPTTASIESIAEKVTQAIDQQNVAQIRANLHPFLKTEIYPQELQTKWNELERANGQFKKVIATDIKPSLSKDGGNIVIVTVEFENATKEIFFIFDNRAQITGIDLTQ